MSQTETILLVVLGFSLAALIALFIGRFVWTLGLRLGARRMQKQVPSTLIGLQTERDRLRAEFAMLSQRMGTRLDQVKLQMAEHMAEVTRHRNRAELLAAEIAARDKNLAAAAAETESLKEKIAALEISVAAAAEALALKTGLGTKDAELASLRLPQSAMPDSTAIGTADQLRHASDGPQERLKRRIDELTSLSRAIAESKGQIETGAAPEPDPVMIAKLGEAARETAELQRELEQLDAEWSKRLTEIVPSPIDTGEALADGRPGAVANVISLANRIRALKKDMAE